MKTKLVLSASLLSIGFLFTGCLGSESDPAASVEAQPVQSASYHAIVDAIPDPSADTSTGPVTIPAQIVSCIQDAPAPVQEVSVSVCESLANASGSSLLDQNENLVSSDEACQSSSTTVTPGACPP